MAATVLGMALLAASPTSAADTGGVAYEASAAPFDAPAHALLGKLVRFAGDAAPNATVAIQRLDEGAWVTEATATADADGDYLARWRTDHIGVFTLRAVPAGGGNQVRAAQADETVQMTVYKPATATWFGPTLYGRSTACGQRLTKKLMGVAHKTLPCGTKVSFLYKGRSITVPVVDRGPFGRGISWDLTYAAAEALDFTATGKGTVGALSLRGRR